MKRYIKKNAENLIIDLFFEWQKNKFDGAEIEISDGDKLKIDGKSISNEFGTPIFEMIGDTPTERSQLDIDNDPDFIKRYKQHLKSKLKSIIDNEIIEVSRTLAEIRTKWNDFKTTAASETTKSGLDTLYNNAITWLGL